MSLRERTAHRVAAQEIWWLRIAAVPVAAKARADLEAAEDDLRVAEVTEQSAQDRDQARRRAEAARAAVAECFEPVKIVALGEADYEALLAEHPPQTEGAAWGPKFGRALLLAGVQGDMSREEWVVFLGSLSSGERVEGYNLALAANVRVLDPGLPKGWMPTTG